MLPAIVARVMSARGPALVPAEGVHGVARLADAASDAARPAVQPIRQVTALVDERVVSVAAARVRSDGGKAPALGDVGRSVPGDVHPVHAPERQKTEDHRAHGRKRSRRAR